MRSFREGLRESPAIGTWSMLGNATAVDAMVSSGLDFVILDLEHGAFGDADLFHSIRAAQAARSAALPRLPKFEETQLLRVLEMAPDGVLVAHVEDLATAQAVVDGCLYPPEGRRGMSPYTRVHGYTHADLPASATRANDAITIGVLIEGPRAAIVAEEVAGIDRLDLIYFGIFDFAQSVGCPGEIEAPAVQGALRDVARVCREMGTVCGTFARDVREAKRYLDLGLGFVAVGSDGYALRSTYDELLRELERPRA